MTRGRRMADFLSEMAEASRERAEAAKRERPEDDLIQRTLSLPPPPPLSLQPNGFDVFAEIKRRAPSAGVLQSDQGARADFLIEQALVYGDGGATAISVLTEPTAFHGDIADLASVAAASPLAVMRKDFLVDPYQVYEARAHGSSGILLIARMLDQERMPLFFDAARVTSQFVLLEIFDESELSTVEASIPLAHERGVPLLIGVNARNLVTLEVDRERFVSLAPLLPITVPRVAESGLQTAEDVRDVARLGYNVALIGSALMRSPAAASLLREMVAAGRQGVGCA